MAQVCARQSEIEAAGGELMFVGSGTPGMARAFQAEFSPGASVAVDPQLRAQAAFQLRRSVVATFSPGAVVGAVRAFSQGYRQAAVQGDAWQQGGAFVIDTAGRIAWAHVARHAGDHASPEELLGALAALEPAQPRGGGSAAGSCR